MAHYKDTSGKLYWIDSDNDKGFLPSDCIPITNDEADELRKPTMKDIQTVEVLNALAKLKEIDLSTIRAIREYLLSQPNPPQFLIDKEAEAIIERAKLKNV